MTAPLATIAFLGAGYIATLAIYLTVRPNCARIRAVLTGLRPKP